MEGIDGCIGDEVIFRVRVVFVAMGEVWWWE